jgi:hypothetical protein
MKCLSALIILSCVLPAHAMEVWNATDNLCERADSPTVDAEFANLQRAWGKELEVLAAPHQGKHGRYFLAIGHARGGKKVSFLTTESEAMCREAAGQPAPKATSPAAPDRQVRGFGNDPGWQWKDVDMRRYATSWRSINFAATSDCTSIDENSVKAYERGFNGQVAHIRIDNKPTVLMVRDNVHVYLMPVTANECRQYAVRFGGKP